MLWHTAFNAPGLVYHEVWTPLNSSFFVYFLNFSFFLEFWVRHGGFTMTRLLVVFSNFSKLRTSSCLFEKSILAGQLEIGYTNVYKDMFCLLEKFISLLSWWASVDGNKCLEEYSVICKLLRAGSATFDHVLLILRALVTSCGVGYFCFHQIPLYLLINLYINVWHCYVVRF